MTTNRTLAIQIRVMLYPQDFQRTMRFYTDILQWQIRKQGDGLVMFEMGCATLELLSPQHLHWRKNRHPVQGCGLSLQVADVWSLWAEIQNKVSVLFPLRQNPWEDDSFGITDPEGFELT